LIAKARDKNDAPVAVASLEHQTEFSIIQRILLEMEMEMEMEMERVKL